jgi:hypothetical protein
VGGIDLIDMLIALYPINIRSEKYDLKIIFHLIDLSIVNAWLLYHRHCNQFQINKKEIYSLLEFLIAIVEAMLKPMAPQHSKTRARPSLQQPPKLTLLSQK